MYIFANVECLNCDKHERFIGMSHEGEYDTI